MEFYDVKNKYNYERVWQMDYSYSDRTDTSDNIIEGRYIKKNGQEIISGMLAAEQGVAAELSAEQTKALIDSGCFVINATAGCDGCVRVTFFDENNGSFMSVANIGAGENSVCFSMYEMKLAPKKLLVENKTNQNVDFCINACYVLNPLGEWGGQAGFYTCEGGDVENMGEGLKLALDGQTRLVSPEFPDCSDTVCNMLMPRRNTILAVISNNSTAKSAKLYFTTHEHTEWSEEACVTVGLCEGGPRAYYFNLSESQMCEGRLKQFALVADGEGEIIIHRYSFEQEAPVWSAPAKIESCVACVEDQTVKVCGKIIDEDIVSAYAGGKIKIYATTMEDEDESPCGKVVVGECDIGRDFCVDNITLYDNGVSRLSGQFAIFAEVDGKTPLRLCERFYVDNYEVFDANPYPFDLPDYTVSVLDFGALGDAYTDDTAAIQSALDHVSAHGGGRVVLDGDDSIYGRRYIATNLLMPSNTELHISQGAVLWQSQIRRDYTYRVTYGHDGVVEGINWTHNMHVSNLPLIQAANAKNVKITGRGKIRGMDIGSEEGVDMHMRYSSGCPDRIHVIMIGFFNVDGIECRDFEIVRCNNYHTGFYHCSNAYIANLKFHEVKCLSGDGIGLMIGTHDVTVNRCFVQSNDDYLVLVSVYHDPRGLLWWTNAEGTHCGPYNITMRHCFVNAGTGGGVAFITWGTSDPVQERAEICGIRIYDNYFDGHKGIGGWFDNPYNGRVPFDNAETDDYSPVRDVRIYSNRYTRFVTMGPVHCTDFISDCGLYSHYDFVNGDFSLGGLANWTARRNQNPESVCAIDVDGKQKGKISRFECGEVSLSQGLYLLAGRYLFDCELETGLSGAELFVQDIISGEILASRMVVCTESGNVSLDFEISEGRNLYVGIRSFDGATDGFAVIDNCSIKNI